MALSCPFKEHHQALSLSVPLSSRRWVVRCPRLTVGCAEPLQWPTVSSPPPTHWAFLLPRFWHCCGWLCWQVAFSKASPAVTMCKATPFSQRDACLPLENRPWHQNGRTTTVLSSFQKTRKCSGDFVLDWVMALLHACEQCDIPPWNWSFLVGAVRWSVGVSGFGRPQKLSGGHLCMADFTRTDKHNA